MRSLRSSVVPVLLCVIALSGLVFAQSKSKKDASPYACTTASQTSCTAANTCGSASTPCEVDVKKTPYGIEVIPSTQENKKNTPFCVAPGTKVTFKTSNKNTGFIIDFGPNSPLDDPDTITGGTKHPETVTAQKSGCYGFSAGACVSGAVKGMCNSGSAQMVVTGK